MKSRSSKTLNVVGKTIGILLLCLAAVAGASAQTLPILGQVAIPANPSCPPYNNGYPSFYLTLNPTLNLIYVSGGFTGCQYVSVIDGSTCPINATGPCTFSIVPQVHIGSAISVDIETENYWAPEVESGDVQIYSAPSNSPVDTVTTGYDPGEVAFDGKLRRMWVGAQNGHGNDPVFVFNADTPFAKIAGPIGTGGVMGGGIAVNPVTGRCYVLAKINNVYVPEEVDPNTFLLTHTNFGIVFSIDAVADRIYAVSGTTLQIVNGAPNPEKILKTKNLGYTPLFITVNNALDHIYLANTTTMPPTIEVRDNVSLQLVKSFPLPPGLSFDTGSAVDSLRGRLYVSLYVAPNGPEYVYAFEDLATSGNCLSRGNSCGAGIGHH